MIIDGKVIAARRLADLRFRIQELRIKPKLAIVLVGNDLPAGRQDSGSIKYVELKKKRAQEVGIEAEVHSPSEQSKTDEIIQLVKKLNQDKTVDGVIVQLPLPKNLDAGAILETIDLKKDVDGLRPGSPFLPAAVKAILIALDEALGSSGQILGNIIVTVIGQGTVGKPAVEALEKLAKRVNRADKNTLKDQLLKMTQEADVLISATGVSDLVTAEMVKPGAILIDVGWPKAEITAEAAAKSSAFTPVPGGIGPLTVASLLENVVEAARIRVRKM